LKTFFAIFFFCLLYIIHTDFGAHPTSYPIGGGGEADPSPPSTAEIKNMRIYTSIAPHVFIALYLMN
jgi:hypothetical protein